MEQDVFDPEMVRRKALYELQLMIGNGIIDLGRLRSILEGN